jgi:hypothetical protein
MTTSSDPGFINHREAVTAILRLKSHQRHPRKSYPRQDFHPGSRSSFWDSSYSLLYFRRGSERFENTGRLADQSGKFSSGILPLFRILFFMNSSPIKSLGWHHRNLKVVLIGVVSFLTFLMSSGLYSTPLRIWRIVACVMVCFSYSWPRKSSITASKDGCQLALTKCF